MFAGTYSRNIFRGIYRGRYRAIFGGILIYRLRVFNAKFIEI